MYPTCCAFSLDFQTECRVQMIWMIIMKRWQVFASESADLLTLPPSHHNGVSDARQMNSYTKTVINWSKPWNAFSLFGHVVNGIWQAVKLRAFGTEWEPPFKGPRTHRLHGKRIMCSSLKMSLLTVVVKVYELFTGIVAQSIETDTCFSRLWRCCHRCTVDESSRADVPTWRSCWHVQLSHQRQFMDIHGGHVSTDGSAGKNANAKK